MARAGLAALIVLAAVGAPAADARTRVVRYTPFTADGDVKSRIKTVSRSGSCRLDSRFVLREEAWRCRTGRVRRDPCFDNPVTEDQVVCVKAPWSRRAVVIDTPLDDSDRAYRTSTRPWALRVGRRRCLLVLRSRRRVRRHRLTYSCGRRGPFLFGRPNRRKRTWTIRIAKTRRGKGLRRARIRAAYR
jgi:hypothetical protein